MTRKSKREIRRDLDDLEEQLGDDGANILVATGGVPEEYQITVEPPEEDPVDAYSEVAIPNHLPPEYRRGGVSVLGTADITALWDTMPDDIQEREREYRREHGEPLPPVLG